jgi:hypothetical protein
MGGGRTARGVGHGDSQDEARRGLSVYADEYGQSRYYLEIFRL